MKAVLVQVSEEDLARRRRIGIDRFDEMWEGVLHMVPAPSVEHQRVLDELVTFLGPLLKQTGRGRIVSGINVFRDSAGEEDYRIPDLTFVSAGRESVLAADGTRGGGPDVVIEIRSPADESYEKLPFYGALGVREVVVIDRDDKRPEIHRLAGKGYEVAPSSPEGWVESSALGVRMRRDEGASPRLEIADLQDPERHVLI